MDKRITLLAKRPDIAFEQFDAYWAGPHVTVVTALPGMKGYIQNHVIRRHDADDIDGIVEIWFETPPERQTNAHFSPEQLEDELRFLGSIIGLTLRDNDWDEPTYKAWLITHDRSPEALNTIVHRMHVNFLQCSG